MSTLALPPIEEAAVVSATVASAMSEVARAGFADTAMAEFTDANEQFGGAPPYDDPGHFVRDVAESFLISSGDFVCGLQYVTAPDHELTFSSGSLARSACEYANKASWVAADGLSMGQRIARALAILKDGIKEEKPLYDGDDLAALEQMLTNLDRWRNEVSLPNVEGGFSTRTLFKAVNPKQGGRDFKRLSNAAHGSLLTTVLSRRAVTMGTPDFAVEAWWRVLVACMYGYRAAVQVGNLQHRPQPESMVHALQLLDHYLAIYNQVWEAAGSTDGR